MNLIKPPCTLQQLCALSHVLAYFLPVLIRACPPGAFTHPNALHKSNSTGFIILMREVTRAVSPHPHLQLHTTTNRDCAVNINLIHNVDLRSVKSTRSSCNNLPFPQLSVNNISCYWMDLNKLSLDWSTGFKVNVT